MALTIDTLTHLNQYINQVMKRADHHGGKVNEIVLTLAGAVIWKATEDISVRTENDEMKNVLWLIVGANRYVLSYNHDTGLIELRDRSIKGTVRESFSNQTTAGHVKDIFSRL